MAPLPQYVHVVYQGDAASVRVFGYDFAKGVPVLATKAIAERLLEPGQHEGFALYEGDKLVLGLAADLPAPAAPVEPTTDQPEPKEA